MIGPSILCSSCLEPCNPLLSWTTVVRPPAEEEGDASIEFLANIRGGHRHPHRAAMASQDVSTVGQRTSHIRNKMRRSEVYGKLLHEKKVRWNHAQRRNDDETRSGWVDQGLARLT